MMRYIKFSIGLLAILSAVCAIAWVLSNEKALVVNPKGLIAHRQLNLIVTNILLMLVVIVPTMIFLLITAWKYRAPNTNAEYDSEKSGNFRQWVLWVIPSAVIAVMAYITWHETFQLDPYKPLQSEIKPLKIQVVALDWKWLFIYPEQEIATINFVQFPERTPIQFALSADGSPMNSFWIPQLSGQIYSMTGMVTPLHLMADGPGEYAGRAAEINGQGYADMTFLAKSTSQADFDAWVETVRQVPKRLTEDVYEELVKPSLNPIAFFSYVEQNLFDQIVMKPFHHPH